MTDLAKNYDRLLAATEGDRQYLKFARQGFFHYIRTTKERSAFLLFVWNNRKEIQDAIHNSHSRDPQRSGE